MGAVINRGDSSRDQSAKIHKSRKYFLKFFIHKLDASLEITVHGQNYSCNEKIKQIEKKKVKAC